MPHGKPTRTRTRKTKAPPPATTPWQAAVRALKQKRTELERRWRTWLMRVRLRLQRLRKTGTKRLAVAHERSATAVGKFAFASVRVLVIVTAPFLLLIRGAVWLYHLGLPTWLALSLTAMATLGLLTVYGVLISRRFTGKARAGFVAKWVAAPLVVGYCGFALLHVARVNAKDDAVRSVYTATHPLLRLALTTLILVDRDAVITDLARTPDDYGRMGLPVNPRSPHYRQEDGWVHAVDLRSGSVLEDLLVVWYFSAMGFETLRHGGTGYHLHVSLAAP
jgi:hypothetical protein